ncbi:hypothetical protein TNCV_2794291 [Trichonephila clavipes]|nr:hypothetical protein TNCV_2794291 [Trichonephila clavipes]
MLVFLSRTPEITLQLDNARQHKARFTTACFRAFVTLLKAVRSPDIKELVRAFINRRLQPTLDIADVTCQFVCVIQASANSASKFPAG